MSGVSRAYRDPKSPLQPLTPLSVNSNFSFNIAGDSSLKPWIDQFNAKRGKHQSKSLSTPQKQWPQCSTPNIRVQRSPVGSRCQCGIRKYSPLTKKPSLLLNINGAALDQRDKRSPISPNSRMFSVLEKVGMVRYWEFLRQHNINLDRFQKLTCRDLEGLGIRNREHLSQLLKAVQLVRTLNECFPY